MTRFNNTSVTQYGNAAPLGSTARCDVVAAMVDATTVRLRITVSAPLARRAELTLYAGHVPSLAEAMRGAVREMTRSGRDGRCTVTGVSVSATAVESDVRLRMTSSAPGVPLVQLTIRQIDAAMLSDTLQAAARGMRRTVAAA